MVYLCMKYLLLIPFFTFAQQQPKWMNELGEMSEKNKAQHYWVSNLGTMAIGSIVYHYTNRPTLSSWAGGITMFGIGCAKEYIWDGKMKRGVKSGGDTFMNGWGCIFGIMQCRVIIDIKQRKKNETLLTPIQY